MVGDRDMTPEEMEAHHKRQAARKEAKPEAQTPDCEKQIEQLGAHILGECPEQIGRGDPVNGEGAVEIAKRVINEHKLMRVAIGEAMSEIGVPGQDYPANIANAHRCLVLALGSVTTYPANSKGDPS